VPAFVTLIFIPFGYSAAYGLIAGLLVYTTLNGMIYITKLLSCGRFVPEDEDHREYWTSRASCNHTRGPNADSAYSETSGKTPLVHHS
jgi:hypothetical protein